MRSNNLEIRIAGSSCRPQKWEATLKFQLSNQPKSYEAPSYNKYVSVIEKKKCNDEYLLTNT